MAVVAIFGIPFFAAATHSTARPALLPVFGLPTCTAGSWPGSPGYDPVNHELYFPSQAGPNVTVLGPGCKLIATISLPSGGIPQAVAFDPQDDDMYISDFSGNAVDVVHGTTVIATLAGGWFNGPSGITFDPGEGEMFVANWGVSNITGIFGTTIIGSIPVGFDPEAIAYDPFYDSLLVTDYGTHNVTVIASATFPYSAAHSSVSVVGPWGIVYDPVHEYDYVGSDGSSNVTILNGLGSLIGTIHLGGGGHPFVLTYSQAKLHVYVPIAGATSYVAVLNGTTVFKKVPLPTGTNTIGVGYDEYDDKVYVGTGGLPYTIYVVP